MQKVFQPDLFDVEASMEENREYLQMKEQAARQAYYEAVELPYYENGLGWLDEEQQNEIVGDAFLYVFRRYERGIGYTVNKSFISVLKGGVKHALEYTTMKDKEQSLTGIKNITKKARALYN